MDPRVEKVQPNPDFTLTLTFDNGETKIFDVKPYLDFGVFKSLKNHNNFYAVSPFMGTIHWKDGQDFCPDTLYLKSIPMNSK